MRNLHILLLLLTCTVAVSAQQADERKSVKVRNFKMVQQRDSVTMDFTLDIGKKAADTESTLTILPLLAKGKDIKELTPVIVRGRTAEILYKRRFIASRRSKETDPSQVITAKNGQSLKYHITLPFEEWMAGSTVLLDGVDEGCCSAVRTNLGIIAQNVMVPEADFTRQEQIVIPAPPVPQLTTGERLAKKFPFVKPMDEGNEQYSREGITVYFHQDKSNIEQDYRRNRQSLIDILSVVEELQQSGDSEVERIVIAGFA
jgi:hypothetical protein